MAVLRKPSGTLDTTPSSMRLRVQLFYMFPTCGDSPDAGVRPHRPQAAIRPAATGTREAARRNTRPVSRGQSVIGRSPHAHQSVAPRRRLPYADRWPMSGTERFLRHRRPAVADYAPAQSGAARPPHRRIRPLRRGRFLRGSRPRSYPNRIRDAERACHEKRRRATAPR